MREKINNLVYFRSISGEKGIPYSLIRILSGKSNIIKQLSYIEEKLVDEPDNETLKIRWNNLTQYLSDFEKIQLKEFEKKLNNPFDIFMMGYYFDTCLSIPSGDYAESVIINAADINKKVIYAKNRKGDVIGRKLLALSVDLRLLGFSSYGKDMESVFNEFSFKIGRAHV